MKTGKFDKILQVIQEDSVEAPSTSVMQANHEYASSPPTNTEFTTLADLLNYKNGMDIGSTDKVVLGAPLQNILNQMAEAYIKLQDLRKSFKDATQNPVYRDREELNKTFGAIDNLLQASQAHLAQVSKFLDKLSLDS